MKHIILFLLFFVSLPTAEAQSCRFIQVSDAYIFDIYSVERAELLTPEIPVLFCQTVINSRGNSLVVGSAITAAGIENFSFPSFSRKYVFAKDAYNRVTGRRDTLYGDGFVRCLGGNRIAFLTTAVYVRQCR